MDSTRTRSWANHWNSSTRGEDHPSSGTLLTEAGEDSITRQNWQERAHGDVFWARFSVSPLTSGSLQGYVVASQDITAQKQYEHGTS